MVIDISTVTQGVGFTEGGCHGTGGCQDIAPGIVGVLDDRCAAGIQDGGNVTLDVRHIVVVRTIVGNRHGCAGCVISKVQRVTAHGHSAQAAAVVNVAVGSGTVGTLCPQTIGIIGHAPCGGTVGHGCQFSSMLPGIGPGAVRKRIADGIMGNGLAVITRQQIAPSTVAIDIGVRLRVCAGNFFPVVDVGAFFTACDVTIYIVTVVAVNNLFG